MLSYIRYHKSGTLHGLYTFNIINRYLFDGLALLSGNIQEILRIAALVMNKAEY